MFDLDRERIELDIFKKRQVRNWEKHFHGDLIPGGGIKNFPVLKFPTSLLKTPTIVVPFILFICTKSYHTDSSTRRIYLIFTLVNSQWHDLTIDNGRRKERRKEVEKGRLCDSKQSQGLTKDLIQKFFLSLSLFSLCHRINSTINTNVRTLYIKIKTNVMNLKYSTLESKLGFPTSWNVFKS